MCGIVGYSGSSDCLDFLLEGLGFLEYRGYDSAGVAVLSKEKKIEYRKECGVLKNLRESLSHSNLSGKIGVGHTRWATHGKPTQENAHPHFSGSKQFCVVHNGIIENHSKLKKKLIKEGVDFVSETDTEIIPQLIEKYYKKNMTVEKAFLRALKDLEGAFAIVMVSSETPGSIYAARSGSPLLAGFTDDEIYLASDMQPILKYTKNLFYFEEGDVLVFANGKAKLTDIKGKAKKIKVHHEEQLAFSAGMDGFESYTLKEIHEQSQILNRIIQMRMGKKNGDFNIQFEKLRGSPEIFKNINRIYITGCGTAFHAAYLGKYYLEEFMDIPVEVILSSEFRYAKPKLNERKLVISVSQSGETADTLASIIEAKKAGAYVLSVVNVINSSIDRESDFVVYTHAGPEIGVASTKAFTSQVITLLLFSIYFANVRGEFEHGEADKLLEEIYLLPIKLEKVVSLEKKISHIALKYHLANSALYLGRHLNFPVALEGALKNKEISYMHAEGYAAGEMKHGPIALIDKALPVICVCTKSRIYDKMVSNIKEVEAREGIIITIATENDPQVENFSREVIYVPDTAEELTPILNVVVMQIIAYYLAKHKGNEIDKPRNLAKSVTVE